MNMQFLDSIKEIIGIVIDDDKLIIAGLIFLAYLKPEFIEVVVGGLLGAWRAQVKNGKA